MENYELRITNYGKRIWILYGISIVLNFIPVIVEYLRIDGRIHNLNAILYYIFWIFFVIASVINLSFFFLIKKSVRDSKNKSFFAYYASSLFFLCAALFTFGGTGDYRNDWFVFLFIFSIPFSINFLLVFIYRKITKFKQKHTHEEFIENKN